MISNEKVILEPFVGGKLAPAALLCAEEEGWRIIWL
jgi:hypothetical protein